MRTKFEIFGEPVEIIITSAQTNGCYSVSREHCKPGGGPPPHIHSNEDEAFSVISGRFEIFNGESWTEIPPNGLVLGPRGHVHTFRNCGDVDGVIQFICSGNRFDTFLEGLSAFTMPHDLQAMVDYSAGFGITYPTLPPPTKS
jgi:mannose-6-phosphate isomerase-like protein (cupin superfamily)